MADPFEFDIADMHILRVGIGVDVTEDDMTPRQRMIKGPARVVGGFFSNLGASLADPSGPRT